MKQGSPRHVEIFCGYLFLALSIVFAVAYDESALVVGRDLRRDGVSVLLYKPGALMTQYVESMRNSYDFVEFSEEYVENAKSNPVDWRDRGAVTPAKDQGPLGYCGTFGRTAAAEGQFAIRGATHVLRNFSEEELVDCIGWDKDQFTYFAANGFMDMKVYPYNSSGHNQDPPIPGKPCKYDKKKVIVGTANHNFTNVTGSAPSEDQLLAFLHHNGPVNTGINANVFALREKNCEATNSCFITEAMCNDPSVKDQPIDHSITLVGYGTDDTNGDYWIVKNSWSAAFGNDGFIHVARGISCAHIDCCGWVPTYGDPRKYYQD